MANRILIFVPGIMGSQLSYSTKIDQSEIPNFIWSENITQSLTQLVINPALLKYDPHTKIVPHSMIKYIRIGTVGFTLKQIDIYAAIDEKLGSLSDYKYYSFPYDWRQDILTSARKLGEWFKKKFKNSKAKFTLIGHSMGGLVIAEALINKFINPESVEKLITIGTPFGGSPGAFKGLFSTGYLPGLNFISDVLNLMENRSVYRKILLETMHSFESIHELLPPQNHKFVKVESYSLGEDSSFFINPLSKLAKVYMSNHDAISKANQFHARIKKLYRALNKQENIAVFYIVDNGRSTGWEYSAEKSTDNKTLQNVKTMSIKDGDGTVPTEFAAIKGTKSWQIKEIFGSNHSTMCSNKKVLDIILQLLN